MRACSATACAAARSCAGGHCAAAAAAKVWPTFAGRKSGGRCACCRGRPRGRPCRRRPSHRRGRVTVAVAAGARAAGSAQGPAHTGAAQATAAGVRGAAVHPVLPGAHPLFIFCIQGKCAAVFFAPSALRFCRVACVERFTVISSRATFPNGKEARPASPRLSTKSKTRTPKPHGHTVAPGQFGIR